MLSEIFFFYNCMCIKTVCVAVCCFNKQGETIIRGYILAFGQLLLLFYLVNVTLAAKLNNCHSICRLFVHHIYGRTTFLSSTTISDIYRLQWCQVYSFIKWTDISNTIFQLVINQSYSLGKITSRCMDGTYFRFCNHIFNVHAWS